MDSRLLRLPPLDPLRGFVAAARQLSFTRAAEELCLTQSAVSRQIQTLEAALGVRLEAARLRLCLVAVVVRVVQQQLKQLQRPVAVQRLIRLQR